MAPNESAGPTLYSPGKLCCIRLHFGGILDVFPTSAHCAIIFGAPYFGYNGWKEPMVGNGIVPMVGKRKHTKQLNVNENQRYEK